LNVSTAFVALNACEQAVTALYRGVVGSEFPYRDAPRHKPGQWLGDLAVLNFYSAEARAFINRLDGFSLDRARFESEAAFNQYVKASGRSHELVAGTIRFVDETEALSKDATACAAIRAAVLPKKPKPFAR
jgi:hypothetical protein